MRAEAIRQVNPEMPPREALMRRMNHDYQDLVRDHAALERKNKELHEERRRLCKEIDGLTAQRDQACRERDRALARLSASTQGNLF